MIDDFISFESFELMILNDSNSSNDNSFNKEDNSHIFKRIYSLNPRNRYTDFNALKNELFAVLNGLYQSFNIDNYALVIWNMYKNKKLKVDQYDKLMDIIQEY